MSPVLAAMGARSCTASPRISVGAQGRLELPGNRQPDPLTEALVVSKQAGMDLNTTYEAIRFSSGNSFVHETESQVILNGSRNINFTMDLVVKDMSLFPQVADRAGVSLEFSPLLLNIFEDGQDRYGPRERSPIIIRRFEHALGIEVLGRRFPAELVDGEPEQAGCEATGV